LYDNLRTEDVSRIESPLLDLIEAAQPTFGFYNLNRVQDSKKLSIAYYDIWILTTKEDDVKKLDKFSNGNNQKCCYWDGDSIYKYLTGFIKYIGYDIYDQDEGISHAN